MFSAVQDKEIILIACANSFGEALKFVDESFYKEKDFMIQVGVPQKTWSSSFRDGCFF